MGTLYIDRQGCELHLEGRAVAVYEQGKLLARLPGRMADRVVLSCEMTLTTAALTALAEMGAGLVVVRRGKAAILLGGPGGDATRRLRQYERALDEKWRVQWSRRLVGAKLRAQMRFLREVAEARVEARAASMSALKVLSEAERECHGAAVSIETLRGLEGASAASYFAALRALFAPSLGFRGRNRRPPKDPVNAALSLGYMLAYGAAASEINGAGLDPHIGFYHAPRHGRASLACDLVEPLRARIDAMVWTLFRERLLRPEHFKKTANGCLLGKAGRRAFYRAWGVEEDHLIRFLRAITGAIARGITVGEESIEDLVEESNETPEEEPVA